MKPITLYIASSLDGFIARKDGDISWLEAYQQEGQDYGYSEFLRSIDIIVMGSKTYEQILTFGPWPYGDIKTYVLTRREFQIPEKADVILTGDSLEDLISRLRNESQKGIWLAGGALVARSFLRLRSVDRIILTVIPRILGDGIPLLCDLGAEAALILRESRIYDNGIVQMHYDVERQIMGIK